MKTIDAHRGERLGMAAILEVVGHHHVALAAHVSDPGDTGRRGAVIPVTVVAGGRGRVTSLGHGFPVDAATELLALVGRQAVGGHVLGIRVASLTGIRDSQRMNRRPGIRCGTDAASGDSNPR